MSPVGFAPLSRVLPYWPADIFGPADFLDEVGLSDYDVRSGPEGFSVSGTALLLREAVFRIPGAETLSLAIPSESGSTEIDFSFTLRPEPQVALKELRAMLRIPGSLLHPVQQEEGGRWVPIRDEDGNIRDAEITFQANEIRADLAGNVEFSGAAALSLGPVVIGETGLVVELHDTALCFSDAASAGSPFRGLTAGSAVLHLPPELNLQNLPPLRFQDLQVGNTGFSGRIYGGPWNPEFRAGAFQGPGSGTIFGIPFGLRSLEFCFQQNVPTSATLSGEMLLPFFDTPVGVDVSLGLDGAISVAISASQPRAEASGSGLVTVKRDDLFSLTLDSLRFGLERDIAKVILSGSVHPTYGERDGLAWPEFEVQGLSIDSEGNVALEGGWLDLRRGYALELYGFRCEITKIGFGKTDDGGKWIGFSGGFNLVDGLSAGASVEGLRIAWYGDGHSSITLNGVGVEFEVPDVLRFKGEVSFREYLDKDGILIRRFDGGIALNLISLGVEVDGELVIGIADGQPFMAIYLMTELPAGIPLWSTGLALYGMAGLFALQMEPDKQEGEPWYAVGGNDWFHRRPEGVAELDKWDYRQGSLALGAGVTLGTLSDNGYMFNGRFLLVIVFPGPVLMLEGRANILKARSSLSDEPVFHALAVLDARAGEFLIGLDARYRYAGKGELIDIAGGSEMFFSLSDPEAWHLWLGNEPRDERIQAQILKLFEANGYFKLEAKRLAMGAWIGYRRSWNFRPLRVTLEAWLDGNADLSWCPPHFHGDLWLHGKAALKVWRFGTHLTADARLVTEVFDPFHISAELSVGIGLPWPLPDFDVDIELEWGPDRKWPPLPLPLKEVAIEHFKVGTSWPLRRASQARGAPALLLPDYNEGEGIRTDGNPPSPEGAAPPANVPVVPMDCRPHITFSRAVLDEALAGGNVHCPPNPQKEWIGDPSKGEGPAQLSYSLKEVAIEKWVSQRWDPVARSSGGLAGNNQPDGATALFGSWAPLPAIAGGSDNAPAQTKLWIWSINPFEYTRRASRSWEEWFTRRFENYPCLRAPGPTTVCFDFSRSDSSQPVTPGWFHPDQPGLTLQWTYPKANYFQHVQPVDGLDTALIFPARTGDYEGAAPNPVTITLPAGPNAGARLTVRDPAGVRVMARDASGTQHGLFIGGSPANPYVNVPVDNLSVLFVLPGSQMSFFRICILHGPAPEEVAEVERIAQNRLEWIELWKEQGFVFEPGQTYRLKIVTQILCEGEGELNGSRTCDQTEYAYFRTEGPPGLANLSLPPGTPPGENNTLCDKDGHNTRVDGAPSGEPVLRSELNGLSLYVYQTLPPTVPAAGEKPSLYRPVYRAYDVGVHFNENYVCQMYRMAGRDLTLQLFDANNRPVRDTAGRLVILDNHWDQSDYDPLLDEATLWWTTTVNRSTCVSLPAENIRRPQSLVSCGHVMEPDALYEARLTPLLLREMFTSYGEGAAASGPNGRLGEWQVVDQGDQEGPSRWQVTADVLAEGGGPLFALTQRSNIHGDPEDGRQLVKPGTMLLRVGGGRLAVDHPDHPANWTDYRFCVQIRCGDDDAVGVVFRYRDVGNYYRLSMDRQRKYRRLVRVVGGTHTRLAEDGFVYEMGCDYRIVVEAVGSSLRVYQDDELVFDVVDNGLDRGSVGLYCWGSKDVRFADIRVDDLRKQAPVVYRFQFATSRYANFYHQMHSYDDETWRMQLPARIDVAAALNASIMAPLGPTKPSDMEIRGFDALVEATSELAATVRKYPQHVEVLRIEQDNRAIGFLVQSPEPVDWGRVWIDAFRTVEDSGPVEAPGSVKITGVSWAANAPIEESVTLLLREKVSLSGFMIEYRLPSEPAGGQGIDPPWRTYKVFDGEASLHSGARIRVFSGSLADNPVPETGVVLRFVASIGEAGSAHFGREAVDLRVRDNAGRIVHARRFLRDGGFSPQFVRILRKPDGTAFFVLPSVDRSFAPATYRLRLHYRRDAGDELPRFSQAGDQNDEVVELDIPWRLADDGV